MHSHHLQHTAANAILPTRGWANGFSLVEMIVVIAIIAILGSIAVPAFYNTMASMRSKNVASQLHVALMKTRSEAFKRNANVTLSVSTGGWQLYPTASTNAILDSYTAPSGVVLSGATEAKFNASGRVPQALKFNVKATMSSATSERCVTVGLSGLPKVGSSACS